VIVLILIIGLVLLIWKVTFIGLAVATACVAYCLRSPVESSPHPKPLGSHLPWGAYVSRYPDMPARWNYRVELYLRDEITSQELVEDVTKA
jgi:hypothetical protein